MSDTASERPDVDALAQFIRTTDGDHSMGAGRLAEAICESDWYATEINTAKAEAWEEGYVQGKGAGVDFFTRGISEPRDTNPYRTRKDHR